MAWSPLPRRCLPLTKRHKRHRQSVDLNEAWVHTVLNEATELLRLARERKMITQREKSGPAVVEWQQWPSTLPFAIAPEQVRKPHRSQYSFSGSLSALSQVHTGTISDQTWIKQTSHKSVVTLAHRISSLKGTYLESSNLVQHILISPSFTYNQS